METNQSDYKIQNLESSLAYLQQEHADILKLLHVEIKELQMKNSELSLAILMKQVGLPVETADNLASAAIPQIGAQSSTEIERLQERICQLSSVNESHLKQLDSYENAICVMTGDIDALRMCHSGKVSALESELCQRNAELRHLSNKLEEEDEYDTKKTASVGDVDHLHKSAHVSPAPAPTSPPRSPTVVASSTSFTSKIFKLRTQMSSLQPHTPNGGRPIVARHTFVCGAHPAKSRIVVPPLECLVASEERHSSLSQSVKRSTILPPINSSRHHSDNSTTTTNTSSTLVPFHQSVASPPPSTVKANRQSSTVDNSSVYLRESSGDAHTCNVAVTSSLVHGNSNVATVDVTVSKTSCNSSSSKSRSGRSPTGRPTTAPPPAGPAAAAAQKIVQVDIDRVIDLGQGSTNSNSSLPPLLLLSNHHHNKYSSP